MFSSVDLPQPEGHMMATNYPSETSMLTLLRATVSTSVIRKILSICFSSIIFDIFTFKF